MTYSITITDKKEAITIADGMITMTGSEPHTRVHVHGTQGVHYAKDGPVSFVLACSAVTHSGWEKESVTLQWGVIGKHGIYENRQIKLTRVDEVLRVTYRALFTVDLVADEPVTYTVYKYRGECMYRKGTVTGEGA